MNDQLPGFSTEINAAWREYQQSLNASLTERHEAMIEVLRRMRCSGDCGGRVEAAWLVSGPILNARVRPRRVALRGPEARE